MCKIDFVPSSRVGRSEIPLMGNALVPEIAVTDWKASKRFYCEVLGFGCRYERPDEGFAYLNLGEAELMIDQIGAGRTFDDGHLPVAYPFGKGVNLQIRVADVAQLVSAIQAAGMPLYLPLEEKWYGKGNSEVGNWQFVVADPDGYLLRFYQDMGSRPR